jgi:hypothetical protein
MVRPPSTGRDSDNRLATDHSLDYPMMLTRKTMMKLCCAGRVLPSLLSRRLVHATQCGSGYWVGLLLLAACASSPTTSASVAQPGNPFPARSTASGGPPAFSASATAATEGQAYPQAARRLWAALLADDSLLLPDVLTDRLAGAIHDRATDSMRIAKTSGGIQIDLGLGQEGLRSAFARLDAALSNAQAPAAPNEVAQAVHAARLGSLRRALCLRQRTLVTGAHCEPFDTAAVDRQLAAVFASVSLRSVYDGGVPMRDQAWLRPMMVEAVLLHGGSARPLPNLPVRIQSSDGFGPVATQTGANGIVLQSVPKNTPVTATWTVSFDPARMLGALARLVSPISTTLRARATGLSRAALVHVQGKPLVVETAQALLASLASRIPHPVELVDPDARALSQASVERMKEVAPKVADRLHGTLDTILLLEAESEFASRMENQRVWYEARGTLRVFDAWSGEKTAEVTATVTESGLGEPRAEGAAREALGRELARRLEQRLRVSPPVPSTP